MSKNAGLRWCVNSKRKTSFFIISLLDMVPRVCLSLVTSGTFSLAQNIFLTNQRPWRAFYFCTSVTGIFLSVRSHRYWTKRLKFPPKCVGIFGRHSTKYLFRRYTWELWYNAKREKTNRSCTGMAIKTAALVAFFESSIKKNQMKIHLLVMEVNQFELRETSFTRSNE